jgi:hypothetical protein
MLACLLLSIESEVKNKKVNGDYELGLYRPMSTS